MSKPKWDQHAIKAELHRRGMTLTKLAQINGLNPNNFRGVWSRSNRPAESVIAAFLETPVEELFPDRYPVRSATILSLQHDRSAA